MPGRPSDVAVLIAGGGTAGHVLPGLAVAEALVASGTPRTAVEVAGSERGIETRLVPEAGFRLHALPGRGIQRRLTLANIGAIWSLLRGTWQGVRLVGRLRPRAVVVLGGFAAVPCTVGAVVHRVPIVVMEQNARAGLANRLAGRFARVAAVSFPGTDLRRAVVTGNPVRAEVLAAAAEHDRTGAREALGLPPDRTVLAVFSGSLGARRINEAVLGCLPAWAGRSDLAVHHVVGARDWEAVEASVPTLPDGGLWYRAVRYEDRMDELLVAADVAVCRAGGTTVAELAAVGLPAVLVPLPIAPRDHQWANATALVEAGAALVERDEAFDAARMQAMVEPLLASPAHLEAMRRAALDLARPDAAERVAQLVAEIVRTNR